MMGFKQGTAKESGEKAAKWQDNFHLQRTPYFRGALLLIQVDVVKCPSLLLPEHPDNRN